MGNTGVMVLLLSEFLIGYVMWIIITYLTDKWEFSLTHAAAIVNLFVGATTVMPVFLKFLVDITRCSYHLLVFLSCLFYTTGLLFFWVLVLVEAHLESIGGNLIILLYIALGLMAVGLSLHYTVFKEFLIAQDPEDLFLKSLGRVDMVFFVAVIETINIIISTSWPVRFGLAAFGCLLSTIIFLIGIGSCNDVTPEGCPCHVFIRVFVAAASKMFRRCPITNAKLLYNPNSNCQLPHTRGLRCLDKAAIIVADEPLERNKWKLCSVTEVEQTKALIRMIPVWMTFIISGLVSSIGMTYFLEQADQTNNKVWIFKITIQTLLWAYWMVKSVFSSFYQAMMDDKIVIDIRPVALVGILLSMISSILCCIIAASVEKRRLDEILHDDVKMSILWLVPQFFFLGALDGINEHCFACFVRDGFPPSLREYMVSFCSGLYGLGIMSSVLTVYIVGKISEKGGKTNWFQDTLNESRVDKFYWTLATMSAANLVFYILVAICYFYNYVQSDDMRSEPDHEEITEHYALLLPTA